jgi:hypothetical protein
MSVRISWIRNSTIWTGCGLALGLGLRLYHYLRDPSVWHDEAALILNVLGKSFTELLGPLFFAEAAPPLFLWIEKAVSLALGDSTFALRLVPFVASCAALVLLVLVARRVLCPPAVPWAVLLFACSDRLLWHACEAKPYAVDILAATAVLALFGATRSWPVVRQLLLFTTLAPLLLFVAYPGCFLCGGVLVALLPLVWRENRPAAWLHYGLLTAVILGSFALLLAGPVQAQRCDEMTRCWVERFPPWDRPYQIPLWTVVSSLEVVRYSWEPTGNLLFALAVVGGVRLWRRGQRRLVVLMTLPAALALAASFLRAYPFGGVRVLGYAVPAVLLLLAEGIPLAFAWLRSRSRLGVVVLAFLLLLPIGQAAYRVGQPWPRLDSARAAAFVRERLRPRDLVVGTIWDHNYQFRDLGAGYQLLHQLHHPGCRRLWLLAGGKTAAERSLRLRDLESRGFRNVVEQHDFTFTTVYCLESPDFNALAERSGGRSEPPRNRP